MTARACAAALVAFLLTLAAAAPAAAADRKPCEIGATGHLTPGPTDYRQFVRPRGTSSCA